MSSSALGEVKLKKKKRKKAAAAFILIIDEGKDTEDTIRKVVPQKGA